MRTLQAWARLKLLQAYGATIRRTAGQTQPPHRILAIRPDHLGDLLVSVPALKHVKQHLPDCHLGLLVGPWNLEAAGGIPYVDEVIPLAFPWFDRAPKRGPLRPYQVLFSEAGKLHGWDTAVVLRHDFWWGAVLVAKAGIPRRIGYSLPEAAPFLTEALAYEPAHEVEQTLRLAEALTGHGGSPENLEFVPDEEDRTEAAAWLQERGLREFAVIHPGAGAPVKEWSVQNFAAVADGLGLPVVITGAASERALVQEVMGAAKGLHQPLVGAPLGRVAAVLARASLTVGVDSGILHLATAVGTPTVRLIGPVDPARFGPWGDPALHRTVRSDPPCVWCNRLDYSGEELGLHPCIRAITVERVLEEARSLWRRTSPGPTGIAGVVG